MNQLSFWRGPLPNKNHSQVIDPDLIFLDSPVSVLRRPYQRRVVVTVKPSGVIRVTTSKSATVQSILNFLKECEPWLKKVTNEYKKLRQKYPPKQFLQGEAFLYEGNNVYLDFVPTSSSILSFQFESPHLKCLVPRTQWNKGFTIQPQPHLHVHLINHYRSRGRQRLKARLQQFSHQMKLYPTSVSFRSQKTRWGSCSSKGAISLNWRLLAAPSSTLDYVVVHELAHLKHMNHSQQFWGLVEEHSPHWRYHRQWLKDHQYEFDFLAKESELHGPNCSTL